MTTFTVSFQGFTFTNRLLGMKLLSHPKGAPQKGRMQSWIHE